LTYLAREKPRGFWEVIKKQYKQKSPWSNTFIVEDIYTHFNDLYGSTPNMITLNRKYIIFLTNILTSNVLILN